MHVSQHRGHRQQIIDTIKTAVTAAIKASTLFDFTQPQMRAALAGHKAALSLLSHQQPDMAYILQHSAGLERVALLPTVAVNALSWDDGLAPLETSLTAMCSATAGRDMTPAWAVQWPLLTVPQAEWYFERKQGDSASESIAALPAIPATRLLTHIGMPQKLLHMARIKVDVPAKGRDPLEEEDTWPVADLQNEHVLQLQKAALPDTSKRLVHYLAAQFSLSNEDATFRIRCVPDLAAACTTLASRPLLSAP